MASASATLPLAAQHRRGRAFVALAAIAWSTAGILQRELSVGVPTQLAGRALFAVVGLLAYIAIAERGAVARAFRAIGRGGLAIAALMAISSGSFLIALNHASVANILFMQALAPLLAAVLGMLLGEPVSRRTWLAMTIALGGVALMVGGPGRPSALGLGLSVLMTSSFRRDARDHAAPARRLDGSGNVPLAGRRARRSCAVRAPRHGRRARLGLLVALGVGQIGLGLVFLTIGGRLIPAAEVALITLLEVVLGPLWVWIFLSEQPSAATLAGGAIVLGAVAIQAGGASGQAPPPP